MQQLSTAGLDEYEIHVECQQMRDELIAKRYALSSMYYILCYSLILAFGNICRLHAQQSSQYDVHFHPAIIQCMDFISYLFIEFSHHLSFYLSAQLRKAEAKKALLLKQKISTNSMESGKLVSSDDGSLPRNQNTYIAPDIDSELPTKLRVPSFNKARTNTTHSSSSSNHSSERLSKVGEQVISNRDTKIVLPKRHQSSSFSSKDRKQDVKRKDSPVGTSTGVEEELDDDALAQAIKASLLDIPHAKVGAEDKREEVEHKSRRDDTITANTKGANDNNNNNNNNNRSSSLPSSGDTQHRARVIGPKGRHVLLQRQHEKNPEPVQALPPQPSGQPTSSRSRTSSSQDNRSILKHSDSKYAAGHKRPADDIIRPHLREHLNHNRNLPPWVAETVEEDTEDKLLAMAIANSLSDAGGPAAAPATIQDRNRNSSNSAQARGRVGINDADDDGGGEGLDEGEYRRGGLHHGQGRDRVVDPNTVEYCEEDEMLARALHESMNGF